jgi:hypothetical protein
MERCSVMLCLFIVMACCCVYATCYVSCFPHERDALLAFKNEYDMELLAAKKLVAHAAKNPFDSVEEDADAAKKLWSWRGFNCCEWYGVQCSHSSSHVIKLRFYHNYVLGHFNGSDIDKPFVPVLFQLKYMEYLDLSGNYFSGHLPKGTSILNHFLFGKFKVHIYKNYNYHLSFKVLFKYIFFYC